MRQAMPSLFFLMFLFSAGQVCAQASQDKEKISNLLYKSRMLYDNTPQYKANASYKLFASYTSAKIIEQYDGITIKHGNDSYSMIGTTEFVSIGGTSLKIDRKAKLMSISKNEPTRVPGDIGAIEKFMVYFKDFKLSSQDGMWICSMTAPEVSFIPYGKVIVYINKSDYSVARQLFYLLKGNEYKTSNGEAKTDLPLLEVTLSGFDSNGTASDPKFKSKFSLKHYIQKGNSKRLPSKNYKDFKIVN